ncbi:hypothetical protein ACKWTF_008077 [Chironomus riparius]
MNDFIEQRQQLSWRKFGTDENLTDQMDTGDDLTCIDTDSLFSKRAKGNNRNKKQPFVKAKKTKSNNEDFNAVKIAIENNVKIDDKFYSEHLQKVKYRKGISKRPQTVKVVKRKIEEDTFVPLSIDNCLIKELERLFGYGRSVLKDVSEQHTTNLFIKSSTAKQLYNEILETFYSHQEEAKIKDIESDHKLTMKLREREKPNKYSETNGNSLDEWEQVEKPYTLAEKLNKEKLNRIFSNVENDIIDKIFEVQGRNFKNATELIQDSLEYTQEQRMRVKEEIENSAKFNTENDKENNENNACLKKVKDLQHEIGRHSETYTHCLQQSQDHTSKEEFHIASYYTSMLHLHKQLCDEKRQELMIISMNLLIDASSLSLDLHYLTQKVAKNQLHTFLDAHISKLRKIEEQNIELEIITGRGNHSVNGPVLKDMAIKLLNERFLIFIEGNPGMLIVKLLPSSFLYEECQRLTKYQNLSCY